MFEKILVANRGAVACRIIQTCRRLGVKTVSIYSPVEGYPLHAELADDALDLGVSGDPVASYLDISRVVDAAKQSGADAVHPGYGFLSENPNFARACADAGLRFVGPPADVIRLMGNKREARMRLSEAGVPVLPGTSTPLGGTQSLEELAESIGYPLMVKASDGGGGIGLRLVHECGTLRRAVDRARSSARRAFGSEDVYLERYIPHARHIEVQIVADSNGLVSHLWERECSVQRRHQKVIEEAPSPSISDATRDQLVGMAVLAATDVGYTNVGTVEFIVDPEEKFYFLEANTRLQVEHGTTEMVTGVDIVEQQLRIASDLEIELTPPPIHGHAIQCRVYAEDPRTFIPSPGVLDEFAVPAMDQLRVDTSFRAGDEVSSYFDPLLAKFIAWGRDRSEALSVMTSALADTRVAGVKTNLSTLQLAIAHPDFIGGKYTTGLLPALAK